MFFFGGKKLSVHLSLFKISRKREMRPFSLKGYVEHVVSNIEWKYNLKFVIMFKRFSWLLIFT